MIDARRFATAHSSFWQSAAPTCDLFVRRVNLDGYQRWDAPLNQEQSDARQALAAEYAFARFAIEWEIREDIVAEITNHERHVKAWREATNKLRPYERQGLNINSAFSEDETSYAKKLIQRLNRFFATQQGALRVRPSFPGCGFIDMSEGDVLSGSTLFEVKSVDRMIRGIDLRQLLTYAALNSNAGVLDLKKVGIVNPRRGISAEFVLEEICLGISGKHADTLLNEIVEAVSSGEMSR